MELWIHVISIQFWQTIECQQCLYGIILCYFSLSFLTFPHINTLLENTLYRPGLSSIIYIYIYNNTQRDVREILCCWSTERGKKKSEWQRERKERETDTGQQHIIESALLGSLRLEIIRLKWTLKATINDVLQRDPWVKFHSECIILYNLINKWAKWTMERKCEESTWKISCGSQVGRCGRYTACKQKFQAGALSKFKQNVAKNRSRCVCWPQDGPETGSKDGVMGATAPWSILMRGGGRGRRARREYVFCCSALARRINSWHEHNVSPLCVPGSVRKTMEFTGSCHVSS